MMVNRHMIVIEILRPAMPDQVELFVKTNIQLLWSEKTSNFPLYDNDAIYWGKTTTDHRWVGFSKIIPLLKLTMKTVMIA